MRLGGMGGGGENEGEVGPEDVDESVAVDTVVECVGAVDECVVVSPWYVGLPCSYCRCFA